ncbi:histidine phosphatase family protein [Pseudooceanicola algae]|uniref:Uncharacterized protein n=1 Tax=Pseudooceanicola algae TaxID=1537215 RepID=A0A418SGU1_9RHOB|nr:histidine phosphatase family protein [Pseudooceanicola algae]QPM88874.1 hypothetical protein PSAL_000770 [Pseudooceanicola algae]
MTRLFLVRHGPTHAKCMVGWTDLPADLSDQPRLDALSDYLPKDAHLISSDLQRCRATADCLAGPGRHRLPDDPALRELHFGAWEMKQFAEIDASDPDLSRRYWTEPGAACAPDGESWNQMAARVGPAIDRHAPPGRDLIAVVHFAVILSQVARFTGQTPTEVLAQPIEPLSVTRIDLGRDGPVLRAINHQP